MQLPPGNWFVPPGSNQSGDRGNEVVGASGVESRGGELASRQAVTRVNAEQARKRAMQEPILPQWEKAEAEGTARANGFHQTCRGSGDGMPAEETRGNPGSPSGDRGGDQRAARERQAGRYGVAEGSVVAVKPGNSGGGKGSQLKTNARSDEGHGD